MAHLQAGGSMFDESRKHFFTWFGIIGAAITLSAAWKDFLEFADLIRDFLNSYQKYLYEFWTIVADVFGFSMPRDLATLISMIIFIISISIGVSRAEEFPADVAE
jgi:hypothetical protein